MDVRQQGAYYPYYNSYYLLFLFCKMRNFVINLDRRSDKWAYMRCELDRVGINVTRFSAFDTKPGWHGCRDSHIKLMEECRDEGVFLILEDDVKFLCDDPVGVVLDVMEELPYDWDALFLGASPQEPQEKYSKHLYRLKNSLTAHAIVWHNRHKGAIERILCDKTHIKKIDIYLSDTIYPNYNCFLIKPLIATQVQFKSDTCGRSDVSTIEKNYNKYCK